METAPLIAAPLLMVTLMLVAWGIAIAACIFWVVEIIDVLRRDFADPITKLIWVLVVIFLHLVGAIIYYIVGRPTGRLPGSMA